MVFIGGVSLLAYIDWYMLHTSVYDNQTTIVHLWYQVKETSKKNMHLWFDFILVRNNHIIYKLGLL